MVTDIANWHCCLCVVNTWYGMLASTILILVIHRFGACLPFASQAATGVEFAQACRRCHVLVVVI